MSLALEDFLPSDIALPPGASPLDRCLARRESYDVMVWEPESGGGDAGAPDGGGEPDAGIPQDTPAEHQPLVFVSVFLRPDACDMGESPLVDAGATYAIDVARWRIAAIKR